MTNEKDQTIARLLDESKDMIKRFESLTGKAKIEEVAGAGPAPGAGPIEILDDEAEPAGDGVVEIFVEEDGMRALAEFRPPAGGGKPLAFDQVDQALFNHEVVHGIQLDAIRQALDTCNLDRKRLTDVVVAQGTVPVPFVPAHIHLEDKLFEEKTPDVDGIQSVDFKDIQPFIMVEQGSLLAIRVADAFGSPGTDVLGREVPYPTKKQPEWVPGANLVDTPVGFEAGVDGRLVLEPPKFSVNPVLELKEGVNYKTGNIRFKGEVIVHGKIAAGFAVEAGGSLSASDTIDAFDLKVGRDLVSPGGIIGNGEGRMEVGGLVRVKFLEHVRLVCQGDVWAESVVMNSVVKTRGKLILGDKGILAGGQIHSLNGVEVHQIGTATGPRTELYVGLDFAGMERITWIRDRSKELHAQLKKVDAAIPYGGARVPELMAAAKKLRVEIVQLTETARMQLMKLGQNEDATVEVRGAVFPSTHIEICHVQFLVTQKMTNVKFFLDKRKGTIGVEPLPVLSKNPPPRAIKPTKP